MKDKLTPKVVAALGVAAIAAVAMIGWFGFVSPQRSKAADLDQRIGDAQTQLVVIGSAAGTGSKEKLPSGAVLTRAMPREVAMRQVLRQLVRAANGANVRLDSVTPQAATAGAGFQIVPMDVVVTGRYFAIQQFLHGLRTQTVVLGGHVKSSGRLFSVDTVNLVAGEDGLPQLAATIHVNAFAYSGSAATSTATSLTAPDLSTSTSAVAAGGTP